MEEMVSKPKDYEAMARRALAAKPGASRPADDEALPGDPPLSKSKLRPLTAEEQEAVDWYLQKTHPDWNWPARKE